VPRCYRRQRWCRCDGRQVLPFPIVLLDVGCLLRQIASVLFLCIGVSCATHLDPQMPPATAGAPRDQWIRFPPLVLQVCHRPLGFRVCNLQFEVFLLPAGSAAYHDGCDVDWCWGVVQMPNGHTMRWAAGLTGSPFETMSIGTELIWKQTDTPVKTYGVVRLRDGSQEFRAHVNDVVLTMRIVEPADVEHATHFAQSGKWLSVKCPECVVPIARRHTPSHASPQYGRSLTMMSKPRRSSPASTATTLASARERAVGK